MNSNNVTEDNPYESIEAVKQKYGNIQSLEGINSYAEIQSREGIEVGPVPSPFALGKKVRSSTKEDMPS